MKRTDRSAFAEVFQGAGGIQRAKSPPLRQDFLVYGASTLNAGKLTFLTDSVGMAHNMKRAKETGAVLTVSLMSAQPIAEFTGTVEAVVIVSDALPTTWEVRMVEHSARPRRCV